MNTQGFASMLAKPCAFIGHKACCARKTQRSRDGPLSQPPAIRTQLW
jgi:hypothetical protein